MKKIFILTGEPSGDKLASTAISKLQSTNPEIEYLSVGGVNLKKLGINSIFDLKDITYLGFTSVIFNIFKIRNKINQTVDEIIKFNPDILFSVDSPDFTLRVAEKVKKLNNKIKTVAGQTKPTWRQRRGQRSVPPQATANYWPRQTWPRPQMSMAAKRPSVDRSPLRRQATRRQPNGKP